LAENEVLLPMTTPSFDLALYLDTLERLMAQFKTIYSFHFGAAIKLRKICGKPRTGLKLGLRLALKQ